MTRADPVVTRTILVAELRFNILGVTQQYAGKPEFGNRICGTGLDKDSDAPDTGLLAQSRREDAKFDGLRREIALIPIDGKGLTKAFSDDRTVVQTRVPPVAPRTLRALITVVPAVPPDFTRICAAGHAANGWVNEPRPVRLWPE